MHDIVKHKECGWINELYKRGKQLIKFMTGHTRVNYYGTYSKLQLFKLAKTRNKKLNLNQVQPLDLVAHLLMVLLQAVEVKNNRGFP